MDKVYASAKREVVKVLLLNFRNVGTAVMDQGSDQFSRVSFFECFQYRLLETA